MPVHKKNLALFVTGTDTGVGKTVVTAALARFLSDCALKVGVMKPIETGVDEPAALGRDGELLRWAANNHEVSDCISPYRFAMPVAPAQAAKATKTHIDIDRIAHSLDQLRTSHDIVLVEGVGGLMVPIQGGFLVADLVTRLDLPVLIITHPFLGTINHTLLTTFAAQSMGLNLIGYIINRMPISAGEPEKEAPHWLASLASSNLLGVLPEVEGDDQARVLHLVQAFRKLPTLNWLMSSLGIPPDVVLAKEEDKL